MQLWWQEEREAALRTLKMVVLMRSEWMAATPLTVCDATRARYAMRTCCRQHTRQASITEHAPIAAQLKLGTKSRNGIEVRLIGGGKLARHAQQLGKRLNPRNRDWRGCGRWSAVLLTLGSPSSMMDMREMRDQSSPTRVLRSSRYRKLIW